MRRALALSRRFDAQVAMEGLKLTYKRVPITDEQAPLEKDFDTIVRTMQSAYAENAQTAFVYNCAMGRGRTTSGLVISCLTWRTLQGDSYDGKHWDLKGVRRRCSRPGRGTHVRTRELERMCTRRNGGGAVLALRVAMMLRASPPPVPAPGEAA